MYKKPLEYFEVFYCDSSRPDTVRDAARAAAQWCHAITKDVEQLVGSCPGCKHPGQKQGGGAGGKIVGAGAGAGGGGGGGGGGRPEGSEALGRWASDAELAAKGVAPGTMVAVGASMLVCGLVVGWLAKGASGKRA